MAGRVQRLLLTTEYAFLDHHVDDFAPPGVLDASNPGLQLLALEPADIVEGLGEQRMTRTGPRLPDPPIVERKVTLLHQFDDQGASHTDSHRRLFAVTTRR